MLTKEKIQLECIVDTNISDYIWVTPDVAKKLLYILQHPPKPTKALRDLMSVYVIKDDNGSVYGYYDNYSDAEENAVLLDCYGITASVESCGEAENE